MWCSAAKVRLQSKKTEQKKSWQALCGVMKKVGLWGVLRLSGPWHGCLGGGKGMLCGMQELPGRHGLVSSVRF
jgi:hypothetical protein